MPDHLYLLSNQLLSRSSIKGEVVELLYSSDLDAKGMGTFSLALILCVLNGDYPDN